MTPTDLEAEARRLHHAIYGPCHDKDWNEMKDIWMDNIEWLRDNQNGGHHERAQAF